MSVTPENSIDNFKLRITVFDILRPCRNLHTISFNKLRRDCEVRMKLTEKSLDGPAVKELLTSFFSEFLDINEISKKCKLLKWGMCDFRKQDYSAIEVDFIMKVFREYISRYNANIAEIEFKSSRRFRQPVWETLSILLPHISESDLPIIVKDQLDKEVTRPHGSLSHKVRSQCASVQYNSTLPAINLSRDDNDCSSSLVELPPKKPEAFTVISSPNSSCIAMRSTFSTLQWLQCIEKRGAKHESQINWADIDKELLLPYSYSAKKWRSIANSVPSSFNFVEKLKKLCISFAVTEDSKGTADSCTETKKRVRSFSSCYSSDDDTGSSDSDSNIAETAQAGKKSEHTISVKKTALGDILSSLLRKKDIDAKILSSDGSDLEESDFGSASYLLKARSGNIALTANLADEKNGEKRQKEPDISHDTEQQCEKSENTDKYAHDDDVDRGRSDQIEAVDDNFEVPLQQTQQKDSIIGSEKLKRIAKKKRKLLRNEKRIRKVNRALKREKKIQRESREY